jgi:hypothetical protein
MLEATNSDEVNALWREFLPPGAFATKIYRDQKYHFSDNVTVYWSHIYKASFCRTGMFKLFT